VSLPVPPETGSFPRKPFLKRRPPRGAWSESARIRVFDSRSMPESHTSAGLRPAADARMPGLLFVFGTRPETIKLAPLIIRARDTRPDIPVRICVTGQHRELLEDALRAFDLTPDYDLRVMQPGQSLTGSAARILRGLDRVIGECAPETVVVQGDTTSTFCGALAAFHAGAPVAHVEAGLRTGDLAQPFPEEANRVLVSRLASLHFAATASAAANLKREGAPPERVFVTGNTGIDALLDVNERLARRTIVPRAAMSVPDGRRLIVLTAHRRESAGESRREVTRAVRVLARRRDVHIVCVLHPNPDAGQAVRRDLSGVANVTLAGPCDYVSFVDLMRKSYFLLTDSGGVQEEAPSLGKPVLVLRETTERSEALLSGGAVLTGLSAERIVTEASRLLEDPVEYAYRSAVRNPYGDGKASERILDILSSELGRRTRRAAAAMAS
jgi:UDP-N-acetylglucosamine 2-epimerase (non-hydrolysing)